MSAEQGPQLDFDRVIDLSRLVIAGGQVKQGSQDADTVLERLSKFHPGLEEPVDLYRAAVEWLWLREMVPEPVTVRATHVRGSDLPITKYYMGRDQFIVRSYGRITGTLSDGGFIPDGSGLLLYRERGPRRGNFIVPLVNPSTLEPLVTLTQVNPPTPQ